VGDWGGHGWVIGEGLGRVWVNGVNGEGVGGGCGWVIGR
jgi:hypothetical protein